MSIDSTSPWRWNVKTINCGWFNVAEFQSIAMRCGVSSIESKRRDSIVLPLGRISRNFGFERSGALAARRSVRANDSACRHHGPIASGKSVVSTALADRLDAAGLSVAVADLDDTFPAMDASSEELELTWDRARRHTVISWANGRPLARTS